MVQLYDWNSLELTRIFDNIMYTCSISGEVIVTNSVELPLDMLNYMGGGIVSVILVYSSDLKINVNRNQ